MYKVTAVSGEIETGKILIKDKYTENKITNAYSLPSNAFITVLFPTLYLPTTQIYTLRSCNCCSTFIKALNGISSENVSISSLFIKHSSDFKRSKIFF